MPAGLIYRAPDMLKDPHFKTRDAIVTVPHPDFGELRMQNVAPRSPRRREACAARAPQMGEHNDEIYLRLLGLPRTQYDRLRELRTVRSANVEVDVVLYRHADKRRDGIGQLFRELISALLRNPE